MIVTANRVYRPVPNAPRTLPVFASRVPAGFPSPADDHLEVPLDLTEYLVAHPAATFLVTVFGRSMEDSGRSRGGSA